MRDAGALALAIAGLGVLGGLLLAVSEFTTVASVDVASGSCEVINDADPALADRCRLSGFERHGGAFLLIGLLAAAMAWGAGVGGSRPAAVALIAIGGVAVAWSLLLDLPEASETGAIGRSFEGAEARAGTGLWLELSAGVLLIGVGLIGLLWGPGGRERRPAEAAGR